MLPILHLCFPLVVFTLFLIIRHYSLKYDLLDYAGDHKQHHAPVPCTGGLGLLSALLLSLLIYPSTYLSTTMLLSMTPSILVALYDDFRPLSPWWRLCSQVGCLTTYFILTGQALHTIAIFPPILILTLPFPLSLALLVLFGVIMLNAGNMIDGVDGLCASLYTVILAALCLLSALSYQFWPQDILALMMAIIIFIAFNLSSTQRIFLGDHGAYGLGFITFACTCSILNTADSNFVAHAAALFGLPLFDAARVFILRLLQGDKIMQADHQHLHHCLLQRGYTPRKILTFCILTQTVMSSIAVLFISQSWPSGYLVILFSAGFAIYSYILKTPAQATPAD